VALTLFHCPFCKVKPQAGFTHLGVGTMTTKAAAGQNRLHILIEIKMARDVGLGAVASETRRKSQEDETQSAAGNSVCSANS
jgi:hypothetical protein